MEQPLSIGVIGLGQGWRKRYLPALLTLDKQFRLGAVCDASADRTQQEARRLGCAAAAGPTDLIGRDDVAAVLLLDAQWYRLWPLQVAARLGKPLFCDRPLTSDDSQADKILEQVNGETSLSPIMMAFPLRHAPLTRFLHQLTEGELGPVQAISATVCKSRPADDFPVSLGWLDLCSQLMGGPPLRLLSTAGLDEGWTCTYFDYGQGRTVQVTNQPYPRWHCASRLTVMGKHGTATAVFPNFVYWTGPAGNQTVCLQRGQPVRQLLLEEFHRCLRHQVEPEPNLPKVHHLLQVLRAARQSLCEQRPAELFGEQLPVSCYS